MTLETNEIVVTEEMVEAGLSVLMEHELTEGSPTTWREGLVEAFLVMRSIQLRQEPSRPNDKSDPRPKTGAKVN